jgi:hypothetical protein
MLTGLMRWLMKDSEYLEGLHARLHLAGKINVPKDIIRNSEIFDSGYIYELNSEIFDSGYIYELELIDGFMEITAHKKIDLVPISNVVNINR